MSVAQHPHPHRTQNQVLFQPAMSLPREHLAAIQHILNDALALQSCVPRSPPPPYPVQRPHMQWFKPRMDMYESPSPSGERPLVTATFELPGLRKEDIRIDVVDNHMIVAGDRRQYASDAVSDDKQDEEMDGVNATAAAAAVGGSGLPADEEGPNNTAPERRAGYTVREIKRGRFKRVVPLPPGTKLENVKASMHDGILTVTFPGIARPIAQSVPVA